VSSNLDCVYYCCTAAKDELQSLMGEYGDVYFEDVPAPRNDMSSFWHLSA
jgi:hypothetical protein